FQLALVEAGAVPIRVGLDVRAERPGFDPFPQRDLGWGNFAMSRPLVARTLRRPVGGSAPLQLRPPCRVESLVSRADGGRIIGVRPADEARRTETFSADLVIDASGRGALTLDTLRALGRPAPEETTIGVDLMYASAIFAIPDDAPTDWKGVFTFPGSARASRGSLMLPLEGHRWICTVGGRPRAHPPAGPPRI